MVSGSVVHNIRVSSLGKVTIVNLYLILSSFHRLIERSFRHLRTHASIPPITFDSYFSGIGMKICALYGGRAHNSRFPIPNSQFIMQDVMIPTPRTLQKATVTRHPDSRSVFAAHRPFSTVHFIQIPGDLPEVLQTFERHELEEGVGARGVEWESCICVLGLLQGVG